MTAPARDPEGAWRWNDDPAVKKAAQEVYDLCAQRKRWLMSVPVDRSRDSDCILIDGLKAAYRAGQTEGAELLRDVLDIPSVRNAVGRHHVGGCDCPVCRADAFLAARTPPMTGPGAEGMR